MRRRRPKALRLTQIGQQQPDLLVESMPISPSVAAASDTASAFNMPPGGMPDPMQMAQMIASLPDMGCPESGSKFLVY
jgi:hypothetical protein